VCLQEEQFPTERQSKKEASTKSGATVVVDPEEAKGSLVDLTRATPTEGIETPTTPLETVKGKVTTPPAAAAVRVPSPLRPQSTRQAASLAQAKTRSVFEIEATGEIPFAPPSEATLIEQQRFVSQHSKAAQAEQEKINKLTGIVSAEPTLVSSIQPAIDAAKKKFAEEKKAEAAVSHCDIALNVDSHSHFLSICSHYTHSFCETV
jgi:hypothetical protein